MTTPPIDQHVTFIYAADLARSAAFYADVLRLPLVLDQGACRIFRVAGDAFLGVCRSAEPPPSPPTGIILTLVSADVDAWHTYLVTLGVAIEKPPTYNEKYNIYHLFIRDPDGYLLEIQTFRDPSWPAPR